MDLRDRERFPLWTTLGFAFLVGVAIGILVGYLLIGKG